MKGQSLKEGNERKTFQGIPNSSRLEEPVKQQKTENKELHEWIHEILDANPLRPQS